MKLRHLVSLFALALASPLSAQAPSADDPPVTLTVVPSSIAKGGHVTLSGLAYPQPGVPVQLTITLPTGAPTVLTVTPDSKGRYSAIFAQTGAEGEYKINATQGKSTAATGDFKVQSVTLDIDEDVADNKALLGQPADLVKAVKAAVDNVPDSPAKTDMEAKLDQLSDQVKQLPDQSAKLAQALAPYKQMVTSNPDAATILQPMFDHLAQLGDEEKQSREKFAKEVQKSEAGSKTCDAIDHATQALKAVPEMIAILKKPYDFALAFTQSMVRSEAPAGAEKGVDAVGALAKGLPGAVSSPKSSLATNEIALGSETDVANSIVAHIPAQLRATPAYKFVVAETKKMLPTATGSIKGPLALFDKVTALAGDVIAYANEQLFAKYCEKFTGNFTSTMTAHFFTKPDATGKQIEWWGYSTAIKGKITLRYPKEAAGTAVVLSGQVEGGATRFTYHEDVFNAGIFGKMVKGGIVHLLDVAPAATDNGEGGMTNAMTSPTSFYIPITGTYGNGKVTLALSDARADFNMDYTKARTFYVTMAPTTLMLPVMGHFTLPYVGAGFILPHVLKGDFPVQTVGKTLVIQSTASKDFPGNQNDAVYTIDMKICNPDC